MSDRKIFVTVVAIENGKVAECTREEKLCAALGSLADALDVPKGQTLPELATITTRTVANEMAYKGIALLHAIPRLDAEVALQLKAAAERVLKTFLPVEVNWNLYDESRQWTGSVKSHVSQRYAERNFGIPPPHEPVA